VVCVRGADIVPIDNNDFRHIPTRYISQQSFDTKCLQAGDIVVEKSGGSPTQSTGRVAYISQELIDSVGPVVCSNFCVAFRAKEKWNSLFVFYYLQYVYNCGVFFNFEGKTSGLKNLQLEAAYKAVPIEDVDKSFQDKVVAILDGIHRKITVNRQINQNLEAMAKQLYDYWFVQFDFPNEDGKPYKSSGGEMVWNEKLKREIPKGWNVLKLGEHCSFNKRTSNGYFNHPILYLDTSNITNNTIDELQFLNPSSDIIPSRARRLVQEGDIVYSTVRPNLKHFGIIMNPDYNMVVSTGFAVITANWSAYRYFIYQFLTQAATVENLSTIAQSAVSAYPSINTSDIENLDLVVPPDSMIEKYAKTACRLYLQIDTNYKEIKSLTKQRDELLPLLMNGQVSVNSDLSHG
ncbi:MAG: restriction endonuclease subunit S, partial [Prevotellaceae bacterium]|nr:restriction endonuclease subunit S [Prevotellaceae bacterium]